MHMSLFFFDHRADEGARAAGGVGPAPAEGRPVKRRSDVAKVNHLLAIHCSCMDSPK